MICITCTVWISFNHYIAHHSKSQRQSRRTLIRLDPKSLTKNWRLLTLNPGLSLTCCYIDFMMFPILYAGVSGEVGAGGRASVFCVMCVFMSGLSAVSRSLLSKRPPSSPRRPSMSVVVVIAKVGEGNLTETVRENGSESVHWILVTRGGLDACVSWNAC